MVERSASKWWWRPLLAVLLLAVVVGPFFSAVSRPVTVEGQTPPPITWSAPLEACAISTIAVAGCIFVVAGVTWCVYSPECRDVVVSYTDGLQQMVTRLIGSWSGLESGDEAYDQVNAQFNVHPTYLTVTDSIWALWAVEAYWTNNEWQLVTVGGYEAIATQTALNTVDLFMGPLSWPVAPSGYNCTDLEVFSPAFIEKGTTGDRGMHWWRLYDGITGVPEAAAHSGYSVPGNGTAYTKSSWNYDMADTDGLDCSDLGRTLFLRYTAGYVVEDGISFDAGLSTFKIQVFFSNPLPPYGSERIVTYTSPAMAIAATADLEAQAGEQVNVIYDVNDLYEWDGTAELPLATGAEGEVITTPTGGTMTVDEPSFWEGLFGGVSGWLQRIWGILDDILGNTVTLVDSMADVLAAVLDLPVAIGNLFDPAVAVAAWSTTYYPQLETASAGAAPVCFGDDLASVGALYSGSSGAITIPFVLDQEASWTPTSEVTGVTQAGSGIAVMVITVMWLLGRIRSIIGGGRASDD